MTNVSQASLQKQQAVECVHNALKGSFMTGMVKVNARRVLRDDIKMWRVKMIASAKPVEWESLLTKKALAHARTVQLVNTKVELVKASVWIVFGVNTKTARA